MRASLKKKKKTEDKKEPKKIKSGVESALINELLQYLFSKAIMRDEDSYVAPMILRKRYPNLAEFMESERDKFLD